jgi:ATP-dependent Clp protease ATP-binding subunit ClpA
LAPVSTEGDGKQALQNSVLAELTRRYQKYGVEVQYDASLVNWLLTQEEPNHEARAWERLVDEKVSPALIPFLNRTDAGSGRTLLVSYTDGGISVTEKLSNEGGEA